MKRWLFFIFIMVIFFTAREGKQNDVHHKPMALSSKIKPVGQYRPVEYPSQPEANRLPAQVNQKRNFSRTFSTVATDHEFKIGKSYVLTEDLNALPRKQYLPSMGKKVSEDKYHVFFHPASHNLSALPVAWNSGQQKFYPVSPVLHVRGVDELVRTQLKSEGMQEFYYHARMKLLSLESSPSSVLSDYQDLLKRGFDVRLEILKDPPGSK